MSQIAWRLRRCNKRRYANIRRRSEAKHCSSLCSQSEGDEYCGGQIRLKIQQSHALKRWLYSLRARGPHFASKVSYNAGAATDDYVGQRKSPLRGRCRLSINLDYFWMPPSDRISPPKKKSDHIHYYNNVQMPYTSFLGLPLPLPVFRHAEG